MHSSRTPHKHDTISTTINTWERKENSMKAIRINETGGPEVMHLEEIETPAPKEGEILIKVAAAGINYGDLAQRQGAYLTRTRTPMTMGFEFAGTVAALDR